MIIVDMKQRDRAEVSSSHTSGESSELLACPSEDKNDWLGQMLPTMKKTNMAASTQMASTITSTWVQVQVHIQVPEAQVLY